MRVLTRVVEAKKLRLGELAPGVASGWALRNCHAAVESMLKPLPQLERTHLPEGSQNVSAAITFWPVGAHPAGRTRRTAGAGGLAAGAELQHEPDMARRQSVRR
jgi:hypothetical protein